jgi:hypothetical protein
MDHVCWDIIDAKRAAEGWAPVERTGYFFEQPYAKAASCPATLAANDPLTAAALLAAAGHVTKRDQTSEQFNVRQPDHVVLAGQMGLGVFDGDRITYRVVNA